jgi:FemAB-related protein (PEP-CTERM system-associated)
MAHDLHTLQQQLKTEKNLKGETSRQFKNIEKNTEAHRNLLATMQAISIRIDNLEQQIKHLESDKQIPATNSQINRSHAPFMEIDAQKNWNEQFDCKVIEYKDFKRWDNFLAQHTASGYHQSIWFQLIKKTFDHDTKILVAEDKQGNILGGLPLTFFSSKLFGEFAISIPYVNYGGVVTQYFNIAQALFTTANKIRNDRGLSHIEVRTMQAGIAGNALDKKVSMVLALPNSNEELDKQLGAKVRAQYKKAESYTPGVKFGKLELLDDFYKVFARNMRDLGTPVYSKKWFANILEADQIKSTLIVVYMEGEPVSTGFLVGHHHMLEIPWASTIQSANVKNANMWMYRQILAYAINEGYEYFDFGRSTLGAGTYKFKKQWGAIAHAHYWYYLLPEGESKPELNPDNPKYKLVIFLWKLMPIWLTKIIGPHIIKHIP